MRRRDELCRTCRQDSSRALAALVRRTSSGSRRAATTRTDPPSLAAAPLGGAALLGLRRALRPVRGRGRAGLLGRGLGPGRARWNARRPSATRPARRPRPASGRRRRRRPMRRPRRRSASASVAGSRSDGATMSGAVRGGLGRGRGPALRLAPRRRLAGSALRLARAFASRRSLRSPDCARRRPWAACPPARLRGLDWRRRPVLRSSALLRVERRRVAVATGRALVGALVAVAGTEHLGADLERQRGEPHRELEGGAGNSERVHECLLFVLSRKPGRYPALPTAQSGDGVAVSQASFLITSGECRPRALSGR